MPLAPYRTYVTLQVTWAMIEMWAYKVPSASPHIVTAFYTFVVPIPTLCVFNSYVLVCSPVNSFKYSYHL